MIEFANETIEEVAEQAKAPKKRRRLKDPDAYKAQMEADLQKTLQKHREEIARMSAELKPQEPEKQPEPEEPEAPEKEPEKEPETVPENVVILDGIGELIEQEAPLKDPTAGVDTGHTPDLTMEEFFKKTLDLLKAATNAVTVIQDRSERQKHQLDIALSRIQHQKELEEAVGFKFARNGSWYTPRTHKCPRCGEYPTLQQEKGDRKRWLVICDNCWTRTESADGPMQAIKNWNEGKETELSRMLNQPLDRK